MSIFEPIPIGSPVTADQYNALVDEIERVLHDCPSTASFSYLGEIGTATQTKSSIEYSTSVVVPVESQIADCSATCNVLLAPVLYSGAVELALTAAELSWQILGRAAEGTVGTYSAETLPTTWGNVVSADPFSGINSVSVPITLGATAANKHSAALIAIRLAGTWGYSGNIPGFMAFISY